MISASLLLFLQASVAQVEQAPRLTITRDLRIDAIAENLAPIGAIRVGAGGRMLVSQFQDMRYVMFDSLGKRLAVVGARGAGPGEFNRLPNNFGFVGDSIWGAEAQTSQITWFNSQGRFLRQVALLTRTPRTATEDRAFNLLTVSPYAIYSDGSYLTGGSHNATAPPSGKWCDGFCFFVATPTGAFRNLVAVQPQPPRAEHRSAEGIPTRYPIPFGHTVLTHQSSSGEALVFLRTSFTDRAGGRFRITALRPTGDTIFNREITFRGVPISSASADSAFRASLQVLQGRGSPVTATFAATARAQIPPVRQPYRWMKVGIDNSVWIAMQATDSSQTHLVLDRSGNLVGSVKLPLKITVYEVSRTRMWGTEVDQNDVQSVVRYRIGGL